MVRRASRSRLTLGFLVVALVACAGGIDDRPDALDDTAPAAGPAVVGQLSVTADGGWGFGRAVWAGASVDDSIVVVTTIGVFRLGGADADPIEIDRFDGLTQVDNVAISDDGDGLVVASRTPSLVRRYDLTASRLVAEYELPVGVGVRAVSIRTSDRALVADTSVGPIVWLDEPLAAPIKAVDIAAAGRSAVLADGSTVTPMAGSSEYTIVRGGSVERRVVGLPEGASLVDAQSSSNGDVLAFSVMVGESDFDATGLLVLLDNATFDPLASIEMDHPLGSSAWAIGSDVVVWSDESELFVADHAGRPLRAPTALESPIDAVLAIGSGFVTAGRNGELLGWEPPQVDPVVIDEGGITLTHVGVQDDGRLVTAVDFYGRVMVWDVDTNTFEWDDRRFGNGETTSAAFGPAGGIAVATSGGRVELLDESLTTEWEFVASDNSPEVGTVVFNPASGALITGLAERVGESAFDDSVTVWDTIGEAPVSTIGGEGGDIAGCSFFVSRVTFTSDGSLMAVASHDFAVEVVDVATGEVIYRLPGRATILGLEFSPDGDLLVASYDDSSVNVWDTSGFEVLTNYRAGLGGFFAFGILPDSATMAVVEVTGEVSVVDLMTGAPVTALDGGTFRTLAIAVSPDGSLVAVPTPDAGIALWSTQSGQLLTTAFGHTEIVNGLAFSADGAQLISTSNDGTMRRWSLERTTDDLG